MGGGQTVVGGGAGVSFSFTFNDPGFYTAELEVTDNDGQKETTFYSLEIVRISGVQEAIHLMPGESATIVATVEPKELVGVVEFRGGLVVSIEDESTDADLENGIRRIRIGAGQEEGREHIDVIVNDFAGGSCGEICVTVGAVSAPQAVAATSTSLLPVGGTARLDGSGSTDTDNVGELPDINLYTWTLTNKTDPAQPPIVIVSFLDQANVALNQPGEYDVALVVTDGDCQPSRSAFSDAHVTIKVVKVNFAPDPVAVAIGSSSITTATVIPASAAPEVSLAILQGSGTATINKTSLTTSPEDISITGVSQGMAVLQAEILTELGSAVVGSASVNVTGAVIVDFVRITPDPGFLKLGERTKFTVIGFASVGDFPPLPHSYAPDLATAVGTEIRVGNARGIFLGPVTRNWTLTGGTSDQVVFASSTSGVSSVELEPTPKAAGELKPELMVFGEEGGSGGDKTKLEAPVKVEFSPTPIATGFSLPLNESTISVVAGAVVTPKEQLKHVTFAIEGEHPERARIVEIKKAAQTAFVRIAGLSATPKEKPAGDTQLVAKIGDKEVGRAPIIVVVPTTQEHKNPPAYELLNSYRQEGPKVRLGSAASGVVEIKIVDQFGNPLISAYDGVGLVEEEFISDDSGGLIYPGGRVKIRRPNGDLKAGTILDLVAIFQTGTIDSDQFVKKLKDAWLAEQPSIRGSNNLFWLQQAFKGRKVFTGVQRIFVHGHRVSPDYERKTTVDDSHKVATGADLIQVEDSAR